MSEVEEKLHEDQARSAKVHELDARRRFQAPEPIKEGDISEALVSTRWEIKWEVVSDKKCVEARPVATGASLAMLTPQGASVIDPLTCWSSPNGRFGAATSRGPSRKRRSLVAPFCYAPLRNGATELGAARAGLWFG